jgi:hypothetical protein
MTGQWVSKRVAADAVHITLHSLNTLISRFQLEEKKGIDGREKLVDLAAVKEVMAQLPKKAERV